jgi:hypothetical protein
MIIVTEDNKKSLKIPKVRLFRVSHSMKCQNMMGQPFVFERGLELF